MNILFEDNYILVVEKPAGIATQAGKITEKDMASEVNNYLKKAGAKAPAYLIHRLDKPVRGILLFAKTKDAASKLNASLTKGDFDKHYLAYVEGEPENANGMLVNYLYKDSKQNKAIVIKSDNSTEISEKDAKEARLEYSVQSKLTDEITVLDIHLLTGRFHQIRCQLSNAGYPIVGDRLYESKINIFDIREYGFKQNAIGLIAYKLSFPHPKTGKIEEFILQ